MPPKISSVTTQSPAPSRVEALLNELHRELGPELLQTVRQATRTNPPGDGAKLRGRRGPEEDQDEPSGALDSHARTRRSYEVEPTRSPRLPTGLPEIDRLIGGGFPIGCLSEVSGPVSSGRTSLALGVLAQLTQSGAHVAWVDLADAFDPPSAEAAGVVLERVLWVRAPKALAALRCTERILETEGFALAILDLTQPQASLAETSPRSMGRRNKREEIPQAVWLRLTRLVAGKQNTLVLLSDERLAGSRAALAIEMQPAVAHFTGTPALLESLGIHPLLTRKRPDPLFDRTEEAAMSDNKPATASGAGGKVKLKVTSNAA